MANNLLECHIALSSFVTEQDETKFGQPDDVTEAENNCWNGQRITIFGEPGSGVSSLCNMFCNPSATMVDYKKNSRQFGPLTLKIFFVPNKDQPLVCTEIEGLGHYRKETEEKFGLPDLLSMFPAWRFLSESTQKREDLNSCDLLALKLREVNSLHDVDDSFAIRLGFVLSDTVVIVVRGNNLLKLENIVDGYLRDYCLVPTRETDVVRKHSGMVRQTKNIFVIVNFVDFNKESSIQHFAEWSEGKGLICQRRVPRDQTVGIRLYAETSEARATSKQCKVSFIPLFNDSDGREYNASIVSYIMQSTDPPKYREVKLESSFDPVELAASMLLPSFCQGKTPNLRIAKDYEVYRVFMMEKTERKLPTRYQGPDDKGIDYLQRLTEEDGIKNDTTGKISFTAHIAKADNIRVRKIERISSGATSFFHIRATYEESGCRTRLYSKVVELHGLYSHDSEKMTKSPESVGFVFAQDCRHKDNEDSD